MSRAVELDLVIPGEEPLIHQIGDGEGDEPGLEKAPSSRHHLPAAMLAASSHSVRQSSTRPKSTRFAMASKAALRAAVQKSGAGFQECRDRRRKGVVGPSGEPIEADRAKGKADRTRIPPEGNEQQTDYRRDGSPGECRGAETVSAAARGDENPVWIGDRVSRPKVQ